MRRRHEILCSKQFLGGLNAEQTKSVIVIIGAQMRKRSFVFCETVVAHCNITLLCGWGYASESLFPPFYC